MLKKIQVIYRLDSRVVLMWSRRPNQDSDTNPSHFNVYFSNLVAGPFVKIAEVDNISPDAPAYLGKVVYNLIPTSIPGWDNATTNYIRLAPVIGGVEQAQEDYIAIPPYSVNGLRLTRETTAPMIAVGFNKDENRFIPLSVDKDGKLETI